jgi:hypothetical protein
MSTETMKVDVRAELLRQGVTGKVIEAVGELIAAAREVEADAAFVGMRTTRLTTALTRVGGGS